MSNQVIWKFAKEDVKEDRVNQIEEKLNIKFPKDYIECIMNNNGARPRPNAFDIKERSEITIKSLLRVDEEEGNLLDTYEWIKGRLPENIYPFASDNFGNYICFDYRENKVPNVVFWDHEEPDSNNSIKYIAESFSDLLLKLYK
ncbi:SMI1/KNR4 family protein [Halonatronum saccharophilum]|uniref:SMI1/KNR4 family protein n=1 Tax=Halonatronum saccharophilum TaxID=150060 RepID=UPI000488DABD|nr:SMI1/KNR4 family protein [Halonatronum saccharophilum]